MSIEEVVNKIINLPRDYYELNKSMFTLAQESSYFNTYEQITENILLKSLTKEPERIKGWISWSEDQRVSEGQFLKIENRYGTYSII